MVFFLFDAYERFKADRWRKSAERTKRDERIARISQNPCNTCRKLVGADYVEGDRANPNTLRHFYCSTECHEKAKEAKHEPHYEPVPHISNADQQLLIGKSSSGMYFEPGRCVKCGQFLGDKSAVFKFCSDACEQKAIQPFLRDVGSPKEDHDYITARDFLVELEWPSLGRGYDPQEINKQLGTNYDRKTLRSKLIAMRDAVVEVYARRKRDYHAYAMNDFLDKWSKQRTYVLAREGDRVAELQTKEQAKAAEKTRKEQEKEAIERVKREEKLRKEQDKEAAERAKVAEKLREEERWVPKKFEL